MQQGNRAKLYQNPTDHSETAINIHQRKGVKPIVPEVPWCSGYDRNHAPRRFKPCQQHAVVEGSEKPENVLPAANNAADRI